MAIANTDIPLLQAAVKQALFSSVTRRMLDLVPVTPKLFIDTNIVSGTTFKNQGSGATDATIEGTPQLGQPGLLPDGSLATIWNVADTNVSGTGLKLDDGTTDWWLHFVLYVTGNGYIFSNDLAQGFGRWNTRVTSLGLLVNGYSGAYTFVSGQKYVLDFRITPTFGEIFVNGIRIISDPVYAIGASGNADTHWALGGILHYDFVIWESFAGMIAQAMVVPMWPSKKLIQDAYDICTNPEISPTLSTKSSSIIINSVNKAINITPNPGRNAVVGLNKILPAMIMSKFERAVMIGIGDSNQIKDGYGWNGGVAYALNEFGGLWGSGLLCAGNNVSQCQGFGCLAGGGAGATGNAGTNTGAPAPFDDFMPSTGYTPEYSYTASGQIPDIFLMGQSPTGHWFPGMSENLRLHMGYGIKSGWAGSFKPNGRWNASGPETNFIGLPPFDPNIAISTAGTSSVIVDGSWDIVGGSFGGNEQVRIDMGGGNPGDATGAGTGTGPFFLSYWQIERLYKRNGFASHTLGFAGGQPTRFIFQKLQLFGLTALKEHFRQAMLYAGPNKICVIRINEGFNDRGDSNQSWDKTAQAFINANLSSTQQGFYNNTEGLINLLQSAWTANNFPVGSLYFIITPSHPTSLPDDPQVLTYRAAADQLSANYDNVCSVHLDKLVTSYDLSDHKYYEINDPINGVSSTQPHLTHAGYEYISYKAIEALTPTLADIQQYASTLSRTNSQVAFQLGTGVFSSH